VLVLIRWTTSFVTRGRGSRIIAYPVATDPDRPRRAVPR
jgi:hypothetical protein